jgi:dTDP-D-glucose 4,6-dehydratase
MVIFGGRPQLLHSHAAPHAQSSAADCGERPDWCADQRDRAGTRRVVGAVCDLVDVEFRQRPKLKTCYPHSAPARGQPSRSLITYVKDRPGHDRRYAVDGGKIARLGFHPGTGLEAGLATTVRWYLEHESWWRAIVSGEYRSWYARQYTAAT